VINFLIYAICVGQRTAAILAPLVLPSGVGVDGNEELLDGVSAWIPSLPPSLPPRPLSHARFSDSALRETSALIVSFRDACGVAGQGGGTLRTALSGLIPRV